jgi:hypothetical protein
MVNVSFFVFFEEFCCCHSHLEYLLSICLAWVNLELISAQSRLYFITVVFCFECAGLNFQLNSCVVYGTYNTSLIFLNIAENRG